MTAAPQPEAIAERLAAAPVVRTAREALGGREAWIVGGAVRDAVLGGEVSDLDLALPGPVEEPARSLARLGQGHAFELSAEFTTWRVIAKDQSWRIDLTALRGETIEADLAGRDFTVGAIAIPLAGGAPIDPHGGLADLAAGRLRAVGEESFVSDPLRLLRAARIGAELSLEPDEATLALALRSAPRAGEPAGERQLAELVHLISGPDPLRGLALMDALAVTPGVLPELEALRGVEQNPNHHLDVHGHTLAVLEQLLEVERDLGGFAGERAAEVAALLSEPFADGLTRGGALRFGAIVHDLAKPITREERGAFITFIGHDREGVDVVAGLCARLRASVRLTRHLQALTLHHLRLGFMVHQRPLSPRLVHEYLRATEPVAADVTLLTVADRMAARGEGPLASEEMIEAHLELAREILAAALDWRREGPPRPLLPGDQLAAELGIEPGPDLGRLLAELEAAQYAGEVSTRDQAIEHARDHLRAPAGP